MKFKIVYQAKLPMGYKKVSHFSALGMKGLSLVDLYFSNF